MKSLKIDSQEAKIAGMICLGIGTLFVGLLPACFTSQSRQWPVLMSSLLCFGGGVLLSTSMIHILPELREISKHAELLFCAGFFTLYLIDELVHYFCSDTSQFHDHNTLHTHHDSQVKNNMNYGAFEAAPLITRSDFYIRQQAYNPMIRRSRSHSELNFESAPPSQICHVSHKEPCNDPPVGQLGLLFALCLHAILEGLAIGLENSAKKVWLLAGAVASHKLVISFCLGAELSSGVAKTPCKHFTAITIFALGSVAGIGIGMSVTTLSNNWPESIQPILQGLAGGTLLYVTVCEVLPRERARWHNQSTCPSASLIQFFSVAFGFISTTLITKYLEVDHPSP